MKERTKFNIIESPLDRIGDYLDVEINCNILMPYTKSEIFVATIDFGEKIAIKQSSNSENVLHEWKGLKTAWIANVSVPTPIALVSYTGDSLAMVSKFIEGDVLFFNPNSDIEIEVGKQIKTLHDHALVDGNIWKSSERNTFVYYDKFITNWRAQEFESKRSKSTTVSLLDKFAVSAIDLCLNGKPVFNHNDLHDGQIIVNENKIPIIIDFGNWTEETWLNELGFNLFHCIRTDRLQIDNFTKFLNGYLGTEKLSETEKTTLAFYLLFISARALNYFKDRQSSYLPIAEDTHAKVLEYIKSEKIWKKY